MKHKLEIWLDARNLSKAQFATGNPFSRQTIWRIINGETSFSLAMLGRISDATGGEVSIQDLLPLPTQSKKTQTPKTTGINS